MKLLILNGPNINLVGIREPSIYGTGTYKDLIKQIKQEAKQLGVAVKIKQSNEEGKLITYLQKKSKKFDGLIFNPAGYTHTSIALRDTLLATKIPFCEVHLSDINHREDFRKTNYFSDIAQKSFIGKGSLSYIEALRFMSKNGH